jgi:hypothetical protein
MSHDTIGQIGPAPVAARVETGLRRAHRWKQGPEEVRMPEKVLRVRGPEQALETCRATRHERGDTRYREGLERRAPAEIAVEAEA